MSSITGPDPHRIPIANLKPLTLPPATRAPIDGKEIWKKIQGPSEAERAAQLAKQNAVEAHTVYRVDGKIVAVYYQNEWTLSVTGGGPLKGDAARIGRAQGLSGEKLNDFIADHVTQQLRKRYGAALQVEQYERGSAPTLGELHAEIFGPRPTQSPPSFTPARVAYSPDTLAIFGDN